MEPRNHVSAGGGTILGLYIGVVNILNLIRKLQPRCGLWLPVYCSNFLFIMGNRYNFLVGLFVVAIHKRHRIVTSTAVSTHNAAKLQPCAKCKFYTVRNGVIYRINCPSACLSDAFRQWNCCYKTTVWDDVSSWWRQANSLPQGSVPAPTLFNLYTNDLPVICRMFIYAGDIRSALQAETFSKIECTLTADLAHLAKYCQLSETQHVQNCDKCFPPA